ncbi:DUF2235 domain-containing protein [Sphingomonas corticis]|nr:DUF2235 domain-containing protein [Sphingomonas corticis]
MKRLALFLDGTWNTVESQTNVVRLHDAVATRDGAIEQCRYYDRGVGTAMFERLRGGMLGYGLSRDVVDAYSWLLKRYEDGDEIYIVGFSRGAYTARSLAGMIARCGLLRPGARLTPKELFKRYQRSDVRPIHELDYAAATGGELKNEERELLGQSRRVPIRMIAVWDTVGALGIPFGDIPGLSRRRFQFHNTRLSTIFEHAYHALAIDEHRQAFQPTLWTRFTPKIPDPPPAAGAAPPRTVEQRWFAGAHADVGGGNATSLPSISLRWLAEKAHAAGLKLNSPISMPMNAIDGEITDSFGQFMFGLYKLAKRGIPFERTIQAAAVEKDRGWVDTVSETIDASVFDRWRRYDAYRPPALSRWARDMGIDPEKISTAVSAVDGRPLN